MVLLADRGLVNSALIFSGIISEPVRILYTGTAVVMRLIAVLLPFMILSLQSVFESIGKIYEEAALSPGGSSMDDVLPCADAARRPPGFSRAAFCASSTPMPHRC
jgi:ABC-type spermidine/putrescine transport system permease subunit I